MTDHDSMCPARESPYDVCICRRLAKARADERTKRDAYWQERLENAWKQLDEAGMQLLRATAGHRDEYEIVCDGDPRMDGSHERWTLGRFATRDEAEAGLRIVADRSLHAPKENVRIEHRHVSPWVVG